MEDKKLVYPVDLREVQRMIGTSLDLYASLISIFAEESVHQINAIENSITNKDSVSLDNSAHPFKSSLATLGAFKASSLAQQLEMLGKTGKVFGAGDIFQKLKFEYKKVVSYFESNQWIRDWKVLTDD